MLLDGRREEMSSFQIREIESNEPTAAVVHLFKSVKAINVILRRGLPSSRASNRKQCGSCGKQGHFASKGEEELK